eukprot:TRINITY_DN24831_c0_g1_i2.p1 TRINITY_DN24831_c0_g1~~TRINITY_DN24831_c0_g1_i2.p1  ORF type:complete len:260 (-),score=52.64 TRINITY_DN24831_c0_g1_i2:32-730(-)
MHAVAPAPWRPVPHSAQARCARIAARPARPAARLDSAAGAWACAAGCASATLQRRRGCTLARVQLRAGPDVEVKLTTTRCDLWDGSAMVLFLRADAGKVQLGRVGGYLDKVSADGAIQKLIDDTGFDASAGTVQMVKLSDRGLQRIVIVGLGESGGEDWRLAGTTAATELKKLKGGSASMVCIDGVKVQDLVEGTLSELQQKGPESLELLGAYPAGSGEAIELAIAAVGGSA